jgi:hypothetical protein
MILMLNKLSVLQSNSSFMSSTEAEGLYCSLKLPRNASVDSCVSNGPRRPGTIMSSISKSL